MLEIDLTGIDQRWAFNVSAVSCRPAERVGKCWNKSDSPGVPGVLHGAPRVCDCRRLVLISLHIECVEYKNDNNTIENRKYSGSFFVDVTSLVLWSSWLDSFPKVNSTCILIQIPSTDRQCHSLAVTMVVIVIGSRAVSSVMISLTYLAYRYPLIRPTELHKLPRDSFSGSCRTSYITLEIGD